MEMEIEDPFSVVPYHDPSYDIPSNDQILMFDEIPSLGFPKLPLIRELSSCSSLIPESEVGFGDDVGKLLDPDDLISDPFIWELINEPSSEVLGNCEGDPCGNNGERVGDDNVLNSQIPQGLGSGNQMQLSVWPVPPSPYSCSCCQILRDIMHINGKHERYLEIHGRDDVISHAVSNKFNWDSSTENHEHQMFDFRNESIGSVKTFLVQYCQDCRWEGYNILQDPLSNFYQALCIGYNENVNIACNDVLQLLPVVSGDLQMIQQKLDSPQDGEINGVRLSRSDIQVIHSQQEAESKEAASTKSFLATQRERTGKLKLKDFSGYFHLPIHEAAKKMNVCPAAIKKKCRQGGLSRWPYRKIKGIKRNILKEKEILNVGTVKEKVCAVVDIKMLEQELGNVFAKFSR